MVKSAIVRLFLESLLVSLITLAVAIRVGNTETVRTIGRDIFAQAPAASNVPNYTSIRANLKMIFTKGITVQNGLNVSGNIEAPGSSLNLGIGNITAANIIYSLIAGDGVSISGNKQNPTIGISNVGSLAVTSIEEIKGDVDLVAGDNVTISKDGNKITIKSSYVDTNTAISESDVEGYIYDGEDSALFADLDVGGNKFVVGTDGNLSKIKGVSYVWPSAQGGTGTFLQNDGSGNLSWATNSFSISPDSLDFSDFVDNMTLDATTSVAMGGYNYHFVGTGGTSAFTVTNAGNVGIGTTSPTAKLDVNGNIKLSNTSSVSRIETYYGGLYLGKTANDPSYGMEVGTNINGVTNGTRLFSYQVASIAFTDTTTDFNNPIYVDKFVFDRDGKMGVNMLLPGSNLQVNGNVAIGYSSSTAGPNNGLSVAGNVGIGTTSPTTKLHIVGDMRLTGAFYDSTNSAGTNGLLLTSTGVGTTWSSISGALGGSVYLNGGNAFGGRATLGTTDNNALDIYTNSTAKLTVLANGNVGIGTTSPGSPLDIVNPADTSRYTRLSFSSNVSQITAQSQLSLYANSTNYINMGGGASTSTLVGDWGVIGKFALRNASGDGAYWGIGTPYSKGVYNAAGLSSANPYFIASNGYDDVGRVDANDMLFITGNGASSSSRNAGGGGDLIIDLGKGGDGTGFNNGTNGKLIIRLSSDSSPTGNTGSLTEWQNGSGTPLAVVTTAGNVGIGTTSPSAKLHIVGDMRLTGAFYDSTNSAGTSGLLLTSTGVGTTWSSIAGALGGSVFLNDGNAFGGLATLGTTDANALRFITAGTEAMRVLANGNVGIGTTSPSSQMELNILNAATKGLIVKANSGQTASLVEVQKSDGTALVKFDPYVTNGGTAYLFDTVTNFANPNSGTYLSLKNAGNEILKIYKQTGAGNETYFDLKSAGGASTFSTLFDGGVLNFSKSGVKYLELGGENFPLFYRNTGVGSNVRGMLSGNGGFGGSGNATFAVAGNAANQVPIVLKGYSGQTANLLEVQNSSNSNLFIIDANGNVGIGTTSAGASLNIGGVSSSLTSLKIEDSFSTTNSGQTRTGLDINTKLTNNHNGVSLFQARIRQPTLGSGAGYLENLIGLTIEEQIVGGAGNPTTRATNLYLGGDPAYNVPNGFYSLYSASSRNSYFAGNLGIGTTSPLAALDVAGTSWLRGSTAASGGLYVNSSGNVGIGTTSPGYKLDVSQATAGTIARFTNLANSISGEIYVGSSAVQLSAGSGGIEVYPSADGYLSVGNNRTTIGSSDGIQGSTSYGGLKIKPDGSGAVGNTVALQGYNGSSWQNVLTLPNVSSGNVNLLLANNGGNVGIGTTSPGAKLQIDTTAGGADALILRDTTNNASSRFYFSSPLGSPPDLNITADRLFLRAKVMAAAIDPIANGSLTLGSQSSGVQIGNAASFSVITNSANTTIFSGGVSANTVIRPYSSSQHILLAPDGGNVGIGTTGPDVKLRVEGDVRIASGSKYYFESSGTNNALYRRTSDGSSVLTTPSDLVFGDGGLSTTFMTIKGISGNVGIGTTSPGAKLHIYSSSGDAVAQIDAVAGSNSILKFAESGVLKSQFLWRASDSSAEFLNYTAAGPIRFYQSGDYRLTINGGNVGIGTTNPGSKLSIAGLGSSTGTALVIDANGDIWKDSSSLRYKDDVQPLAVDFEKILELEPVSYKFKGTDTHTIGYIAEDLHDRGLTDLVVYDREGKPDAIKYDRLSIYMLEIVKKQGETLKGIQNDNVVVETSRRDVSTEQYDDKIASIEATLASLKTDMEIVKGNSYTASISAALEGDILGVETGHAPSLQSLIVSGDTNVYDLAVAGDISTGLLKIQGLACDDDIISPLAGDTCAADISTLGGPLVLQGQAQEELQIMAGKVVVDTSGNIITQGEITVKKVNIDTSDTAAAAAGKSTLEAGKSEITIPTSAVTANSLIQVTFRGDYTPATRYWIDSQEPGESFTLKLDQAVQENIDFSWLIVN